MEHPNFGNWPIWKLFYNAFCCKKDINTIHIGLYMEKSIHIIETLYKEYENDPLLLAKLEHYVCEQLPIIIKNIQKTNEEKQIRITELSAEQEQFVHNFLNKHFYFYSTTTEKFFRYDKLHYSVISEDDILYHILSSITLENNCLASWKQKTKIHIIKKIKEKSLIKCVPNSQTIQFILGLFCPTFFSSKTEVKYFLCILGDSILKKSTDLLHFLEPKSKNFLRELNSLCYFYIGANMIQSIKYKYHENHSYSNCRFVNIHENISNESLWSTIFQYAIDVFCVACHYSNRYYSSDSYLLNDSNDTDLITHVTYLKDKTPDDLVELFMKEYIVVTSNEMDTISWKNILYCWRNFLESKGLPAILFHDSLRTMLVSHYGEHYIGDQFIQGSGPAFRGITSKYLPLIQHFIEFWEKNIVEDGTELEIEEIRILFKRWNTGSRENLTDKKIIDILTYFFPHIEIEYNKYICGLSCRLWDKDLEIEIVLNALKENNLESLNLDEKYLYYCKYYSEKGGLLVSKSYFERKLA
jgi:hypothetical protein